MTIKLTPWQQLGFRFYTDYMDAMIAGMEVGEERIIKTLGESLSKARMCISKSNGKYTTRKTINNDLRIVRLPQ